MNGYISIREASYKWGVSERRVNQYCSLGSYCSMSESLDEQAFYMLYYILLS